jgi:hypothetical protein
MIVSGLTSSLSRWRRAFGITLSRAAGRARSAQFSFGRRGCRRWSMGSWWRRIKISAAFHPLPTPGQTQPHGDPRDQEEDEPQAHDR